MASKTDQIPPGWDYNPATWGQRLPIVILAIIGVFVAGYLSLYQLNIIDTVWEPFFGNGSKEILNSKISNVLPIPDAALGAIGYLVDAVTGVIGGTHRWKKMPWIVIVFGLAVGPLGFVSVMLVVFQPVLFSAWCTLCLCSAVISIAMIGPAMDEMLASLQYMQRVKRSGASTWKAFWGVKSEIEKVN
ncbi:vitamin K epoxide reductase family protein [Autumnicola musiva]|uniref:Vitamin K epoxide reductase family protein n=1 Tax=Autumnicola musiva TaxID=3075589 RepID=A0ABU3D520_9FLAO|nr:vitamin K epoxide reductase family protein [Zunongwangia sp. F117]MDT0676627.1 vitamin K epoxide reductase family protein [Zunongwangia sp. F117]